MPVLRHRRRDDRLVDVVARSERVGGVTVYRYDLVTPGPTWRGMNAWVAHRLLVKELGHDGPGARAALLEAHVEMQMKERESGGKRRARPD